MREASTGSLLYLADLEVENYVYLQFEVMGISDQRNYR